VTSSKGKKKGGGGLKIAYVYRSKAIKKKKKKKKKKQKKQKSRHVGWEVEVEDKRGKRKAGDEGQLTASRPKKTSPLSNGQGTKNL